MRGLLVATLVLSAATLHAAEGATRLVASVPSTLVLRGSSNVTDWRCTGRTLEGRMDVAAPIEKINEVIDRVEDGNIGVWMAKPSEGRFPQPQFRLTIPVASLGCGNKVMERDLRNALKADKHPTIEFRFRELRGGIEHDIDRASYRAKIAGVLALGGTSREILLDVVASRLARDRFRIQAELPLRMTDFGITPPTALFGVVKAKDELHVRFDLSLVVQP